ncbi:MAG TPA: phospholipase D-like domain-containing protein, partial [Methanocorpusculum sp.]|nr:phospholipase D-like domain-containing protein [Methanocorpusculum sp.]
MRAKQKAAAIAARKGSATKQLSERVFMPGEDGQVLRNLVMEVRKAELLVVLSSYLLQDGPLVDALLERASAGVFVAVLTAASEDLETLADDELSLFDQRVLEDHGRMLDRMAGHILVRTSRAYHAKFLLVDPQSVHAFGVLQTCNMTLDALTGKNIEAGVVLRPDEILSIYSLFLHGFWNQAQHELLSAGVLSSAASGPALDLGTVSLPATYGSSCSLKESVVSIISAAQQRIDISCWTFLHPAIAELLYARVASGIAVNLYVHIPEFPTEMIDQLAAGGVMVYGHPRLHAKTVIADRTYGLLMTANVAEFGMDTGFEAGVFL